MNLTQSQLDTLILPLRAKHIRIELLDYDMKTIDSIEGQVTDGTITADAENDIRRSGNITISIPIDRSQKDFLSTVSGYAIESGGKIWIDKYVKIFVGIDNYSEYPETISWYKMGVFLIDQPTRIFSGDEYSISFSCIDLMAKLTGLRNGQLTGGSKTYPQGTEVDDGFGNITWVKSRMFDVLKSIIVDIGGFTKFNIYKIPTEYEYLPYDIKVEVGATVYELLSQVMDILATWQMYFDLDGILTIEPIPNGIDSIVYPIEYSQFIKDTLNCDFQNVKNQVVVYGRVNELTYFTESGVVYNGNTLELTYDTLDTSAFNIGATTFGFSSLSSYNSQELSVVKIFDSSVSTTIPVATCQLVNFENSKTIFGIEYETSQIQANELQPNELYFVRIYSADINSDKTINLSTAIFEFMGKQSVAYTLLDTNKESPFYINTNLSEPNYYGGLSYGLGVDYKLTLNNSETIDELSDGAIITFMANENSLANPTITIVDGISAAILVNQLPIKQNVWNGGSRDNVNAGSIARDYTVWQVKYEKDYDWFVFQGRCPTVIPKLYYDGDYDNIYSDQLAYERCLWELYKHSNLNNQISLEIVPNYSIDVNCVIPYNEKESFPPDTYRAELLADNYDNYLLATDPAYLLVGRNAEKHYITKRVTYPLGLDGSAQTIDAIEIYSSGNLVGN